MPSGIYIRQEGLYKKPKPKNKCLVCKGTLPPKRPVFCSNDCYLAANRVVYEPTIRSAKSTD